MSIIQDRIEYEFKQLFKHSLNEGKKLDFQEILKRVINYLEVNCPKLTEDKLKTWFKDVAEQNFLKKLVNQGNFEELIFFNQKFITQDGNMRPHIMLDDDDFILAWTQLAFNHNITWNNSHPYASFAAQINKIDTRITLIHPNSCADHQMRAFVRSHQKKQFSIASFCDQRIEKIIFTALVEKKNILIIGPTQSGKTTLLNAMVDTISEREHLVILEDTHEIKRQSPRTTSLLADPMDTKRSLDEYCAMALRMSPDRIILGEIRSREVVPLLLAFNSGHRGGISSLHANNVVDSLERLALLFDLYSDARHITHERVMELVCRNIDLVINIANKRVIDVAKIIGCENARALFDQDEQDHQW